MRHGVGADALDTRWGDTLATWRDRAALDQPGLPAEDLLFRHRDGDWLLFQLQLKTRLVFGIAGQGVRTDWLAVNFCEFVTKRFAQTREIDVWLDVLGVRASPQANAPDRWGEVEDEDDGRHPLPPRQPGPMPQLRQVLGAARPAYGLLGTPFSLRAVGFSSHGSGEDGELLSLRFTNWKTAEPDPDRTEDQLSAVRLRLMHEQEEWRQRRAEELGSQSASHWFTATRRGSGSVARRPPPLPSRVVELGHQYELSYDPPAGGMFDAGLASNMIASMLYTGLDGGVRQQLGSAQAKQYCLQAHGVIWSYAPDRVDEIRTCASELVRTTIAVENRLYRVEILRWQAQHSLSCFMLTRQEVGPLRSIISGSSYGIDAESLLSLLGQLVIINHRPELIATYEADIEHHRQWLTEPHA
jgi:hypothetical protein